MKKNKNINLPVFMRNSNTESVGQYVCLCISCWLITMGLSLLVDVQFEFENGLPVLLLQTFVITALLSTIAFSRWLIIPYVAAVFIAFTAMMLFGGDGTFIGDLKLFFEWCSLGMPEDHYWYSADNVNIVHFFENLGICALVYFLACTSQKSKLCSMLCFGTIVVIYAFGYIEYEKIAIFFLFVGLFTLIANDKSRGKKLFRRGANYLMLGKGSIVPIIAFALCIPLGLGTLLILDNDKEYDIRNRVCSNIAADVQTRTNIYTPKQQKLGVTLYDLGLQEKEDYIGGDLPENESKILATTTATIPTLAKVATYDIFNGKNWISSFEPNYRATGDWEEEFVQYMASTTLDKAVYFDSAEPFLYHEDITFTLKTDSFFLPTIGQSLDFRENTITKNPTLFDRRGQLFSYFGHGEGYSYTLKSHVYLTNKILSDYESLTLYNLMNREDPYYTDKFIKKYTKLPLALPSYVTKAIDSLDLKVRSNYDVAFKVTNYFSRSNGFRYSKTGLDFDSNDNVLTKVFRTKSGHSVYYATAAALMLRHLKVPCRLAAGYYTVAGENGTQVIDRANPYCWIECYFPNIGWIPIDPSPGSLALNEENKKEEEKPEEPLVQNQHTDDENAEKGEIEPPDPPKDTTLQKIIFVSVILLIILYIVLRCFWSPLCYKLRNVRKRFSSTEKQCNFYWRDILRQLNTLKVASDKGDTLREKVERLGTFLSEEDMANVSDALITVEKLRYGDIVPEHDKIENIARTHEILEELLVNKCNPVTYFIKRRLLLIIF